MNLDALSVVLGFLGAVEAALGATLAVLAWREFRAPGGEAAAARRPLLALLAAAALATALLAFPLHWVELASWVPRWPGLLCVEGVRRIGTGTTGPSRLLPFLVAALDGTRFAVLFAAGAFAILRRIPGSRRAAGAAVLLGALAVADGGIALAWTAIPKEEIRPVAGCCTAPATADARVAGLVADGSVPSSGGLAAGYVAAAVSLGAGAWLLRGRGRAVSFAVVAAASLPLAAAFLSGVAAPAVLGLPFHRCAWCAFAGAPETVVGAALHGGAVLCAGWAAVGGEGSPRLLGAASFGFLAAGAMAAVLVALP